MQFAQNCLECYFLPIVKIQIPSIPSLYYLSKQMHMDTVGSNRIDQDTGETEI